MDGDVDKGEKRFTKARMFCGIFYSFSNDRPLCLLLIQKCNATVTLIYLALLRNTARNEGRKECLLAVTITSNLVFILRRSTLTTSAWCFSSGDCIDYMHTYHSLQAIVLGEELFWNSNSKFVLFYSISIWNASHLKQLGPIFYVQYLNLIIMCKSCLK